MFDLWQHLRTALSHLSRAYLVVDALDEMDQGSDASTFLQHLSELANYRPSRIKIIMTSRPVASIDRLLPSKSMLRLRLDEENVDQDISTYVKARLADSTVSPQLHTAIQAAVPGRAKGLFLYAKLAMDALLKDGIDVQQAIREIPENLNMMYTQLLSQHAASPGVTLDLQKLIMQCITHSVRPLRLIEMADILTCENMLRENELGEAKRVVRSACGVLLELLPNETLCVVHHSFTEFLIGETRMDSKGYPILEHGPTHHRLAMMCLSYLQNGCLEHAEPEKLPYSNPFQRAPAEPLLAPFTRYAALNWSTHVIRSSKHNISQTELNVALDDFTAHSHFQQWAYVAGLRKDSRKTITPVFMAIALGLPTYLQHLLVRPGVGLDEGAPLV